MDCIEAIERIYFKNDVSTQVKNLVVFHSENLSSPALEIEYEYLYGLHERIMTHEEEDE